MRRRILTTWSKRSQTAAISEASTKPSASAASSAQRTSAALPAAKDLDDVLGFIAAQGAAE